MSESNTCCPHCGAVMRGKGQAPMNFECGVFAYVEGHVSEPTTFCLHRQLTAIKASVAEVVGELRDHAEHCDYFRVPLIRQWADRLSKET